MRVCTCVCEEEHTLTTSKIFDYIFVCVCTCVSEEEHTKTISKMSDYIYSRCVCVYVRALACACVCVCAVCMDDLLPIFPTINNVFLCLYTRPSVRVCVRGGRNL